MNVWPVPGLPRDDRNRVRVVPRFRDLDVEARVFIGKIMIGHFTVPYSSWDQIRERFAEYGFEIVSEEPHA